MANYKVISASLGGLSNKVFKAGDLVTEKNFSKGNAIKLVEQGFLEEIKEEAKKATPKKETKKPVKK